MAKKPAKKPSVETKNHRSKAIHKNPPSAKNKAGTGKAARKLNDLRNMSRLRRSSKSSVGSSKTHSLGSDENKFSRVDEQAAN